METLKKISFFERAKSLSKKKIKLFGVCSLLLLVFFAAHFALMTKAFNDGVEAQRAETQRAETDFLLGKIDTMETELRGLRQAYIEKKGEAGAKEIDDLLAELTRLRRRVQEPSIEQKLEP